MSSEGFIEQIRHRGRVLACVIRADTEPGKTTFLTPPDYQMQLGFVVYPSGGTVPRHLHVRVDRRVEGTPEVLLVRKGRCLMDTYDDDEELAATTEVRQGDVIMLVTGGHGFRMLEDTVFLELKQGPFNGPSDKRRF